MSLDKAEVIDSVGTSIDGSDVVLNILDSWDWDDQYHHLHALQNKLNTYFEFIESGQIYDDYPNAIGKPLRIDIVTRYPIPDDGLTFLEKAEKVASKFDLTITHIIS